MASPRTGLRPGSVFDVQGRRGPDYRVRNNLTAGAGFRSSSRHIPRPHDELLSSLRLGSERESVQLTPTRDTHHTSVCANQAIRS